MKDISADKLVMLSSVFSLEFSKGQGADENRIWADFFASVGINMQLIADKQDIEEAKTAKNN